MIALGVTMDGQKIPLGFVESATENERVCRQLIQDLIRRGLNYDQGLLVVLDGSKGLYSAVTKALKGYVRVHRCQWHKRENVVSYLPEAERSRIRRKLQKAYDCASTGKQRLRSRRSQARTQTDESICPNESRRGAGGNPDPPPSGYDPVLETQLPNLELHRVTQQYGRRSHPEGQALDPLPSKTPMGRCRTPRHRTSPTPRERIQTPPAAQAGPENRSESR